MGGIFGGGGRLLDISGDGESNFADTWLGDTLGLDGSFGTQGPGMMESWNGARRAKEYAASKAAQTEAEQRALSPIDFSGMRTDDTDAALGKEVKFDFAGKGSSRPWKDEEIGFETPESLIEKPEKKEEEEDKSLSLSFEEIRDEYKQRRDALTKRYFELKEQGLEEESTKIQEAIEELDNSDANVSIWDFYEKYVESAPSNKAVTDFFTKIWKPTTEEQKAALAELAPQVQILAGPRKSKSAVRALEAGSFNLATELISRMEPSEERDNILAKIAALRGDRVMPAPVKPEKFSGTIPGVAVGMAEALPNDIKGNKEYLVKALKADDLENAIAYISTFPPSAERDALEALLNGMQK
jgi:hypothetical protein